MWNTTISSIAGPHVLRHEILKDGMPLTYEETVSLWRDSSAFRDYFITLLVDAPFPAYFWETPPVCRSNANRKFEFVLIDSPTLANARPDVQVFRDYFSAAAEGQDVVGFSNLGNDAYLVAPCPGKDTMSYEHLAVFSRNVRLPQQHEFWRTVGSVMSSRIAEEPLWLSTSGLGVYWLHVRLDTYPKYYNHQPYRTFD